MNTGLSGLCRAGFSLALLFGLTIPVTGQETAYRLEAARLDGTVLFTQLLADSAAFCLHWTHSVAGFPVRDCYRARDGQLVLETSHQPDFAAGLGHFEGRGTMRTPPEGGYLIEGINEPVPGNCLRLRVGAMAVNHTLVFNDGKTSLSQLAEREVLRIMLHGDDEETSGQC